MGQVPFLKPSLLYLKRWKRKNPSVASLNHFPSSAIAIRHIYCVVMLSWGSEKLCKDKSENVKTSYSAYAALVQSFPAELTMFPSTLRRRCLQLSAFAILWCNARVGNSDDPYQTETSHHEVGNVPYLEVAAFGKGCQTVSLLRKSFFGFTN